MNSPIKPNHERHWPGRQRGAVMVLMVIALLAMLLMGTLALDGGHMLLNKTRLQNAVDAAALSGAKTLSQLASSGNASTLTRDAALATLRLNALAEGNEELAQAMGGDAEFAVVELSNSVYGPFVFPGPTDASFVRVTVRDYPLTGFFWGVLQAVGDGVVPNKAVAAIATAGPAPTQPCKIEPLLVCGNPNPAEYKPEDGLLWGFRTGDVSVLKSASKDDPELGPGNFQLLDFGSGGKTIEEGLAGGIDDCNVVGEMVTTEPGNKVGPVAHGLNTRFGDGSTSKYPPDLVTEHDQWLSLDGDVVNYGNDPVQESDGELTAGSFNLFDYRDWQKAYADANCPGDNCSLTSGEPKPAPNRRILNIVIGDCTNSEDFEGKTDIPVLGFACYFTLQPVREGGGGSGAGQTSQIFGQFIDECNADNVPSSTPWDDSGPQIIQLYKTYRDDSKPSTDS